MFQTGDPVEFVYIVKKGEFELLKKLPQIKGEPNENKNHVLASKLVEVKDFP